MNDQSRLEDRQERYGDFVVTKCLALPELNATLQELEHIPSGAQVMYIHNDDPENLFCLSFKTFPDSSKGAAHILEHTVLCGSQKFPVKDPFFAMTRRSLNTFMNALTGSDFTCYPAASLNKKDLYNLLDVYIDAVFHPLLTEMSFLQEGHHLEFTDPQDPSSALQIKGIVFNEMKGSLASLDSRLWHSLLESLVPELPYAYNSGGDPREIPQLTYQELLHFHKTYYHPSRCLFFFYGNIPLKEHLDFLDSHVLQGATKQAPLPPLPLQTRFHTPVRKEGVYPSHPSKDLSHRSVVAFGFLTAPLKEQEEVLALSLLDVILMEDDASLLKAALLKSKLCVQAEAHMDLEMSEIPYAIICKGCDRKNIDAIEELLFHSLSQIAQEEIAPSRIEAALHQLEFARLEIQSEHAPFGLTLFMRSALAKQHGCLPESALLVHSLFEELRVKLQDPRYLGSLIKKHFIDNAHRVRLVMHPHPHLSRQETEEEQQCLSRIQGSLTPQEKEAIVKQTKDLSTYQKQVERQSLDSLPKVTLADVDKQIRLLSLHQGRQDQLTVYHHDCFTNHIVYADLLFDLPRVEEEELPYLHLLTSLLPEMGHGEDSYEQALRRIQAETGGIVSTCSLHVQVDQNQGLKPTIGIKGKALSKNAPALFEIMYQILTRPRLDDADRIEELVRQIRETQVQTLNKRAMRYASHLASSGFSVAAHIHEQWAGLHYFKFIESLVKDFPAQRDALIDKLIRLKNKLFTFHHLSLVLSCAYKETLDRSTFGGLTELKPTCPFVPWGPARSLPPVSGQAWVIPSQVAFTVKACPCVQYSHPDSAALYIAAALFDHQVLHSKIREQGGAYGAGANYHSSLGYFDFHAYRDPHLVSTLDAFDEAVHLVAQGKFSSNDLEQAQLELMQDLDAPISPNQRALVAYGWEREGKTAVMRQAFRDRLLALTPQEVQKAVEQHLLSQQDRSVVVAFGGQELLDKESKILALRGQSLPLFSI